MLVSIALCTYNGERFLREQLDSLLCQTYRDTEIILVDDASTDGTLDILQQAASDDRVKVMVNEQNLGPYKSFEKAISHCRGTYIALSDQDDVWDLAKIEKMVAHFSGKLLLYHNSQLVNEAGGGTGQTLADLRLLSDVADPRGFVLSNCVWGHALAFHQRLKEHILPFPEGLPHDIWIAFAATCLGGIRYLPETLVRYRQHASTHTITIRPAVMDKRKEDEKRAEFLSSLHWIKTMRDFSPNPQRKFFERLYRLYEKRSDGKFVWPLFRFMLQHQHALFRFTRKSWLSRINEIRKQSRGIRLHD